jgi:hypothetical protein
MKKIFFAIGIGSVLASCGNAALDSDPTTDTTTLPVDTGARDAINDTANHINTNTGTYPGDSMTNTKGDVRSSSPSAPGSRNTTPGGAGGGSRQ